MTKVKSITKTCDCCPTQWEGITEDDKGIYIRYRWGYLSVRVGRKGKGILDAIGGKELYGKQIGEEFDSILTYDQLVKEVKTKLNLPKGERR
jgi:hypothetical protein